MPRIEDITIENRGGDRLAAKLNHPLGAKRGWAIFAHCFTCSKDTLAASRIAGELAALGIGVLRLDFTGLGASEGAFEDTSFSSNIEDIAVGAEWLAAHHGEARLLVGHSLGGAAVLAAAAELPEVKGVATIGAPSDPAHVQHLFAGSLDTIMAAGVAEVDIGGRTRKIGKQFVEDLEKHNPAQNLASLKADLLILHAPTDNIVGIDNAAQIFAAAKHPKSFVSLDQADHLLTRDGDSYFAAQVISAWAHRCLGREAQIKADAGGKMLVQSSHDGLFAHDIVVRDHYVRADEPVDMEGGLDSGMAPFDFLQAALGACTAMTVRMVANGKGWALEDCRVRLRHRKADGKDYFERELELIGALDDRQRQELLRIANKCPVHLTLERGSEVETLLLDAQ